LHWWIIHVLMDSIFIYYFWNIIEIIMWKKKFIIFFIITTIFIGTLLTIFTNQITIWISWFAMAVLSYFTLELKSKNNPEYKWWITAIIINIWIWFYPWISLYWHLLWAIFWVIFFYLINNFTKRQLVWLYRYDDVKNTANNLWTLNTKKD